MNQSTVEEHKALAATVEHAIASGQAGAANAAAILRLPKSAERIRNGEDVSSGLGKRFTSEDAIKILRKNGFRPSDIRQMQHLAAIVEAAWAFREGGGATRPAEARRTSVITAHTSAFVARPRTRAIDPVLWHKRPRASVREFTPKH